jgi:hypothetical protein
LENFGTRMIVTGLKDLVQWDLVWLKLNNGVVNTEQNVSIVRIVKISRIVKIDKSANLFKLSKISWTNLKMKKKENLRNGVCWVGIEGWIGRCVFVMWAGKTRQPNNFNFLQCIPLHLNCCGDIHNGHF